jgi:hypothetical protein
MSFGIGYLRIQSLNIPGKEKRKGKKKRKKEKEKRKGKKKRKKEKEKKKRLLYPLWEFSLDPNLSCWSVKEGNGLFRLARMQAEHF